MTISEEVAKHYDHGALIEAIEVGIRRMGKTTGTITVADLAGVDEFHVGGRQASMEFFSQLGFKAGDRVLDIGCGLGGAARYVASEFGAHVTGIDLTEDYIEAGEELNQWTGLSDKIDLHEGNALDLPFAAGTFDGAYMLHVGMNIEDKNALFRGVSNCLKPGAVYGVYDIMRTGAGELDFPVPWAATRATSFVSAPDQYEQALQAAGFELIAKRERRQFALDFFAQITAHAESPGGPPPLGLHILMGMSIKAKMKNIIANIEAGLIAPEEMIARKRPV